MKEHKKNRMIVSFLLIFAIFIFKEIKSKSLLVGKERIIEVCSEGVVYVPPGTKVVKCMGIVKRVIRVIPYQPDLRIGESCLCWECCDGECAIIITCDMEPGELLDSDTTNGTLCLLWLDCD